MYKFKKHNIFKKKKKECLNIVNSTIIDATNEFNVLFNNKICRKISFNTLKLNEDSIKIIDYVIINMVHEFDNLLFYLFLKLKNINEFKSMIYDTFYHRNINYMLNYFHKNHSKHIFKILNYSEKNNIQSILLNNNKINNKILYSIIYNNIDIYNSNLGNFNILQLYKIIDYIYIYHSDLYNKKEFYMNLLDSYFNIKFNVFKYTDFYLNNNILQKHINLTNVYIY